MVPRGKEKVMTTSLANIENMTEDAVLEFIGQGSKSGPAVPSLTINRDAENDDGQQLPIGTYAAYSTEHKKVVYSKTATLRPLMRAYQYRVWDEAKKEYKNRSVFIKRWNDEAFDELGGLACGKVSRKQQATLSEAEKAKQKAIKTRIVLFGLLSMTGQTATGEALEIRDQLVMWSASGSSFMLVSEPIDKLNDKVPMFTKRMVLSAPKRNKEGSTVWYTPEISWDDATYPFDLSVRDGIVASQNVLDMTNKEVLAKWNAVVKKRTKAPDDNKVIDITKELELVDDVPPKKAPLNDDIPF